MFQSKSNKDMLAFVFGGSNQAKNRKEKMINGVAETDRESECLPNAGTEAGEYKGGDWRDCSSGHVRGRVVSPGSGREWV